jgi:hypothetical protein
VYLIEILLPLYDNDGRPIDRVTFGEVRRELVERFGGVTAHIQAPAQGAWEDQAGHVQRDDVVIFEVMIDAIDRGWWTTWRQRLEQMFRQQEIVVRATAIQRL